MPEQKERAGGRLVTFWDGLTPEKKRITVLAGLGAVLVVLAVAAVLSSETITGGGGARKAQGGVETVDGFWWGGGRSNMRAIEDLSADIVAFRREFRKMQESNESALAEMETTRDRFLNWAETTGVEQEAAKARRRLRELDREIKELEAKVEATEARATGIQQFDPGRDYGPVAQTEAPEAPAVPLAEGDKKSTRKTTSERPEPGEGDENLDSELFAGVGLTPRQQVEEGGDRTVAQTGLQAEGVRGPQAVETALVINGRPAASLDGDGQEDSGGAEIQPEQGDRGIGEGNQGEKPITPRKTTENTVPSGSIISGVLLHGMDAPTGSGARGQPVPVLIRVKDLTILPNQFAADFEDCHVLGAGFGSMSEERAFIRLEGISCVDSAGGVLEAKMSGYVVGEDGKVGMRGPIVQRNGALLAKSLQAGILGGFGSAIGGRRSGLVSVTTGGGVAERDVSEVAEEGVTRGVGTALQSLAEFYLEQAQAIFPVVVINSGRPVDVVLTAPFETGKFVEGSAG